MASLSLDHAFAAHATFECSACGETRHGGDRHIPVGWSQRRGEIWCDDCTRSGASARRSRGHR